MRIVRIARNSFSCKAWRQCEAMRIVRREVAGTAPAVPGRRNDAGSGPLRPSPIGSTRRWPPYPEKILPDVGDVCVLLRKSAERRQIRGAGGCRTSDRFSLQSRRWLGESRERRHISPWRHDPNNTPAGYARGCLYLGAAKNLGAFATSYFFAAGQGIANAITS